MVGSNILIHQPVGEIWARGLWTPEGEAALDWLRKRGLQDSTIKEARLGWVNYPAEGWERFMGGLSIPYHDGRLREVGVRFRWAQGDRKYDQRSGTPHRLYGIHQVEEPVVYLTEGEFDSLILRQLGMPAIAVPGSTAWQPHWRWLFRDCQEVFVVFDPDEPGRKGGLEVVRSLKQVTKADLVELPTGQDITDLHQAEGPEGLRRALS